MDRKPLIILAGPTAVGKTSLSIRLAKDTGGEIISADSMQVYRHMDIGSAKITKEEMEGVPHYLVDVLEPEEEFNVVRFQQMAEEAAERIWEKGKIPLVVGGTGFYIQALLYDIDFTENDGDESYRRQLERKASDEEGASELYEMLKAVDLKAAQEIHPRNIKRIVRALEFYHQTGKKISEHNETQRQKMSPYNYAYFVLTDERGRLYERIDRRVDLMMEQGLLDEVRYLKERGVRKDSTAMQGLGYKEILDYLDGTCSLEEAVYVLKRDTRHFAKRQITWFRREREVRWLKLEDFGGDLDRVLQKILEDCREEGIGSPKL